MTGSPSARMIVTWAFAALSAVVVALAILLHRSWSYIVVRVAVTILMVVLAYQLRAAQKRRAPKST